MKIVYLAAGAGGMYCGTCLQANTLAGGMHRAGHDVLLTPVYTPLRTDEAPPSRDRVMFGGVNVYLQRRWAIFRHLPRFLDRLLDHPTLLRWLAARSSTVHAERLVRCPSRCFVAKRGGRSRNLPSLWSGSTRCGHRSSTYRPRFWSVWQGRSAARWACRSWRASAGRTRFSNACPSRTVPTRWQLCASAPPNSTRWWR